MQSRTCLLSALVLSTVVFSVSGATAVDLPKEGSYKEIYASFGTAKATSIGKERVLVAFDENGIKVGQGMMDHTTWHCWGLSDIAGGTVNYRGYCVATDPDGEQFVGDFAGKYPANAKSWSGTLKLTSGAGKYAGISGTETFACHGPEFRPATEGTYFQYCEGQGDYKLQ